MIADRLLDGLGLEGARLEERECGQTRVRVEFLSCEGAPALDDGEAWVVFAF